MQPFSRLFENLVCGLFSRYKKGEKALAAIQTLFAPAHSPALCFSALRSGKYSTAKKYILYKANS